MRDPLLDELAGLFDEIDPPPPVIDAQPTHFDPMEQVLEPVRGPSQQLTFARDTHRVHLQIDSTPRGLRLIGLLQPDTEVRILQPHGTADHRTDGTGWFFADVRPGPICVTLPEHRLTTGWFVG